MFWSLKWLNMWSHISLQSEVPSFPYITVCRPTCLGQHKLHPTVHVNFTAAFPSVSVLGHTISIFLIHTKTPPPPHPSSHSLVQEKQWSWSYIHVNLSKIISALRSPISSSTLKIFFTHCGINLLHHLPFRFASNLLSSIKTCYCLLYG